ncbi:MAG: DUF3089 domain-containing protein [Bacteroidota bacterium]
MRLAAFLSLLFLLSGFASVEAQEKLPYKYYPLLPFNESPHPVAPDYSKADHWCALPSKADMADEVPKKLGPAPDADLQEVDVFFIHPTTYTGRKPSEVGWNASMNDAATNLKTDESTIRYQASAFNKAGRVYAPRYRQAHLHSFYVTKGTAAAKDGELALDFAYQDVKAAFEYYLEHYNDGRPFIIASHSQGAFHGARLMKELVDGKAVQDQLVAAYLVGMPIPKDVFESIEPCETPDDTQCFCSWRTFARDYYPPWYQEDESHILVTNPLTWTTDEGYADYILNQGAVLKKFNKIRTNVIDAQVHKGLLWVNRPKMFGARLIKMNNYHVGDINLYYVNVRENAALRARSFTSEIDDEASTR